MGIPKGQASPINQTQIQPCNGCALRTVGVNQERELSQNGIPYLPEVSHASRQQFPAHVHQGEFKSGAFADKSMHSGSSILQHSSEQCLNQTVSTHRDGTYFTLVLSDG